MVKKIFEYYKSPGDDSYRTPAIAYNIGEFLKHALSSMHVNRKVHIIVEVVDD